MIGHKPECPANWGVGDMPEGPCLICQMLRACEQRVSEETEHAMMEFFYWKPSPPHDKHYFADNICAYCVGRREGLDAARKAVGDLPHPMIDVECECGACAALAAIDALRKEKK